MQLSAKPAQVAEYFQTNHLLAFATRQAALVIQACKAGNTSAVLTLNVVKAFQLSREIPAR